MTNRRAFLFGASAALAAPAIVRFDSLMKLWVPPTPRVIRADEPDWSGRLWVGTTCVGIWEQRSGRIKYKYDATEACGYLNTGTGDIGVGTALRAFPAYGVTPYRDIGIFA